MARTYGGRWKVVGNIGGGGQGDVFRITDATGELAGEWALKRLRRKDRVGRFRQEIDILRRLRHDNIIRIVDAQVAEDGGDEASFLVMPIAQHGDLDARLDIYTGHIDSIIAVAKQVADALAHAHAARVVHRDVKPGNILFPEVGHKVWVADFGLSFDHTAERNTTDAEVVGPRFFTAPELEEGGAVNVRPAADIYSLGQLIFYMLTGGKRIARENVLDSRYAEFFVKGPRHELLRLLLSKMVAPLATRYAAMEVVIREIEQIENWEQTAASGLLDMSGLSAAGKLQKRIAEEIHRKAAFDESRAQDIERIQNVSASASAWLFTRLETTRAQIAAGDVLIASAEANELAMQRPLQVDTGSNTLLEEQAYAALKVRLSNDTRRRIYALRFVVCSELQHGLPATHSNYIGVPGNPRMAVLPFFHEFSEHQPPHMNNEAGFIFGKPTEFGVPDPIPIFPTPPHYPHFVSRSYQDGSMAIVRFNAADWPAAQEDIVNMMRDVLSRMMQHIEQANPAKSQ